MTKLFLITGFLGAGKTTFLKKFISLFSDYKQHIIVNEFGKEGIDGQLLQEIGTALDEINNGSIFCSCRLDKFEEVLNKALSTNPDIIIVEASGLSNPTNIRKILAQPDKFTEVEYMGSICLIDARQFPKVYQTATVVKKQIAISDILIMNKTDLVDEKALESISQILSSHRPDIPIIKTTFGEIKAIQGHSPKEWFLSLERPLLIPEKPELQRKDITLRSYLIIVKSNFTYYNFQKFIEMFLEDTYRVKGFVEIEAVTYLVDCVGNLFKATPYEGDIRSLNELVVLSCGGLPTQKSIKEALKWYPDNIVTFTA